VFHEIEQNRHEQVYDRSDDELEELSVSPGAERQRADVEGLHTIKLRTNTL
jgi:hypothetical protein